MNDATILPCGHSFGAGGLKQVKRMVKPSRLRSSFLCYVNLDNLSFGNFCYQKACFTCSQPTVEGSEKPNLCEFSDITSFSERLNSFS